MASDMNVTLHFNYDVDNAGYQKLMSSLDQLQDRAVKAMQMQGMSQTTIDKYKNDIYTLKTAIDNSFDLSSNTWNIADALNLPEAQTALNNLQSVFPQTRFAIDNMGNSLESNGLKVDKYSQRIEHFKLTLANAFRYNVVNRAIDMITNSIRDMINYVIELDSALNSIRIITGKSSEEMYQFAAANQESAKELGRTATEYAQASLIFYQQGLDDSQVKGRTDAALKLANVTGQSVQEIVNQMTAIWNNFDDGNHNLEYYEDVITALGATTASSSKEIAAGLEKFAAIGDTVGLSYEYAASALATVVATTRQSADTVGTAFKTIFARLQNLSLGKTLEDGVNLTKYTKALENIGVSVLDQNGHLKDMDSILEEIGAKWVTLDDEQKVALANTVGGVRQYQQFIALFDNFEFFKQNVTTALESAGTVTKQNEIYMESYEAKIKQIKATLDSIKFDMFIDKDFSKMLGSFDSFLVTTRVILKDFGGLNQILTVGIALMGQMFLPQIINNARLMVVKFGDELNNNQSKIEKLGSSMKQAFQSFVPIGQGKSWTEEFNKINLGQLSAIEKNRLLNQAFKDLGETGKNQLQALITQFEYLDKQPNDLSQMLETKLIPVFDKLKTLNLNDNQFQYWKDQLLNVDDFNKFKTWFDDINKLLVSHGQEKIRLPIDEDQFNRIQEKFEQLKKSRNEALSDKSKLGQGWGAFKDIQNWTKSLTAAAVAIRGISSAIEKLQEGDKLGAVSQSLSSIGSSLMMTGEAHAMGIGAALTAASTVVSVIKAKMEKELREAKEQRDKFFEEYKDFNEIDKQVDNLILQYGKLAQKRIRSTEEQSKLNSVVEQFTKYFGDDWSPILYYDELGNAIYKTTEQINREIEAKRKSRKEDYESTRASSRYLAEDEQKDYDKKQIKLQNIDTIIRNKEGAKELLQGINDLESWYKEQQNSILQRSAAQEELFLAIQAKMTNKYDKNAINEVLEKDLRIEWTNREELLKEFEEFENIPIYLNSIIKEPQNDTDFNNNIILLTNEIADTVSDQISNSIWNGLSDEQGTQYQQWIISNADAISKAYQGDADALEILTNNYDQSNPLIQTAIELLTQHKDLINEDTSALNQNNESIASSLEHIEEYKNNLDSLDEAIDEINNTSAISTETLSELLENFGDTTDIEELIEQYQNGKITLDELRESLELLDDEYVYNLPFLQEATEATRDYAEQQLILMGYTKEQASTIVDSAIKMNTANINAQNSVNQIKQQIINLINTNPALKAFFDQYGFNVDDMINDNDRGKQAIGLLKLAAQGRVPGLDTSSFAASINTIISLCSQAQFAINQIASSFGGKLAAGILSKIPKRGGTGSTGGGGGGGGGGGSGGEPYEAQLTGYEKVEDELEIIENRLKRIREEEKNTDDIEEKIKLRQQESELLKDQQVKLHEINDLQRKDIADNIQKLRDNGFIIDYDPDAQEWIVHNREHLHDLNDELEKDMEQMIKDTDSLIDSTRKYSEEWREANKIIKDTEKEIQELRDKQLKEEMDAFNDKISDKLFYTAFYEGLDSGLSKLKQIYTEVLQDSYDQLNSLYARGLTDADDEVQKLWKNILKYEKELRDIDDDIYENRIKNIERTEKMLPDTPDKYRKQVELAEQKILLARERAAELWAEGTEEAMEKIHDIYQDEWDALEDKYEALRKLLDQEKDDLDNLSSAAQYILDKQIDALKEQQEQLKDTNKQREKEIELMKLKANLDAANNQKTVRVYKRGQGFVWEANKKAIQDAEKALDDFNKQNEEDELQKEIDALTKYKKQWSDVPKTIEEEENLKKIILQEGANFVQDILNQSIERLDDYTDRYKANAEARKRADEEELEAKKQVAAETEKLESERYNNINQNTSSQNDRNVWYADVEGKAPKEAKIGDAIQTKGGLYVVVKEGTPGAKYNEETGKWSVLLDTFGTTFATWTKDLAGTLLKDDDLKKQIFSQVDELLGPFEEEILPEITNGINDNTVNTFNLNTSITDLNKGLYIYSSDIRDAIVHGQDLVSAAAVHSRTAKSSADDAWSAANFAWARANDASNSANRAAEASSGPLTGTQNHKGIEMGPIGSDKGKQAFNSNLTRIARGDIKDDEMWALLQKGEAVFTPEQLDNITGALNYSLNSINKLKTLNNKMFSLGQLSAINSMQNDDNVKRQAITFGNINITMNGVNDVDSFGMILRNNIKGIFAQTIAKE